jgi:hypothetical protein
MHNYQATHGTLPPAALVSKEGRPLLSWRVLILPYIEEENLYKQFKMDEPWDSPQNIRLLPRMPSLFQPFAGRAPEPEKSFFRVFVGKGSAFEGTTGKKVPDDFPDGASNTILIVQAEEAVPWTQPADLDYAPAKPLPRLGGIFPNTFQVALADGQVRSLPISISEGTLRAAITRNGGERLGSDWHH